jgi:multiple sugar transport system ATP-binding protein
VAVDGVSLSVVDGEFLVLVGPSGCGKTTLLRLVAGLESVTHGRIFIGDRDVTDVPPAIRDVAMVFQDYALYPHMTVRRNLDFGLRLRKVARSERDGLVLDVARILGLDTLLERKPSQLSGGQRQRVAMGRAMLRRPSVFLMDEPLSNLDAKLRVQMRTELIRLRDRLRTTTVFVTHDQVEAMTLGDRVAVMSEGRIQQIGTPSELFNRPSNLFVARFIGSPSMNLVLAHVTAQDELSFGAHRLRLPDGTVPAGLVGLDVILGVRPSGIADASVVGDTDDQGIDVVAEVVEDLGDELLVAFAINASPPPMSAGVAAADELDDEQRDADRVVFTAKLTPASRLRSGDSFRVVLDRAKLYLFDPASGDTLSVPEGVGEGAVELPA